MLHSVTRQLLILFLLPGLLLPVAAFAQAEEGVTASLEDPQQRDTISTLQSLLKLQSELKRNIRDTGRSSWPPPRRRAKRKIFRRSSTNSRPTCRPLHAT